MSRLAALWQKEWLALSRDVLGLAVLFVMPAAFIVVMSLALSDVFREGGGRGAEFAVLSADGGAKLAKRLAGDGFRAVDPPPDEAAARHGVRRGHPALERLRIGLHILTAGPNVGPCLRIALAAGVLGACGRSAFRLLAVAVLRSASSSATGEVLVYTILLFEVAFPAAVVTRIKPLRARLCFLLCVRRLEAARCQQQHGCQSRWRGDPGDGFAHE